MPIEPMFAKPRQRERGQNVNDRSLEHALALAGELDEGDELVRDELRARANRRSAGDVGATARP